MQEDYRFKTSLGNLARSCLKVNFLFCFLSQESRLSSDSPRYPSSSSKCWGDKCVPPCLPVGLPHFFPYPSTAPESGWTHSQCGVLLSLVVIPLLGCMSFQHLGGWGGRIAVSSRLAYTTSWVQGQPVLHCKTQSQEKNFMHTHFPQVN